MAGVKAKTHGSEKRRTAGHPPVGFVGYLEELERRLAVVVPSKTKTRGAGAIEDLDIALRVVEAAPEPDDSWREWHRHTEAFVRNGRAVALAGLAKIQEAMAEFEISISLSPDNAWVYYNRAKVRDRLGERDEALADYRTALAKKEPPLAPRQREVARALVGV